ncbi:hypothetical protein H2199_004968 [Coniosporium tulheliwenetii]|uniref:Uncharacterized protein n=1 Tax=Coniosporium tulheliwenetii TaxID=3383036 RepID=A0ACC2Z5S7_9PEZI|nr:hypothetical protein H2199_004968 [Cladosporium sp. JES 115]
MSASMSMSMSGMAPSSTTATAAATTSAAGHSMGGMSMSGGAPKCKISMLWNWYTIDACFISRTWHITSNGMFAVSCIGVAFLVVALEFLRRLGKEYDAAMLQSKTPGSPDNCAREPTYVVFRPTPLQQLIRSLIHMVQFGVAYIIMLLAMYYNGYIIISIFLGAFLGKFLCDWGAQKVALGQVANGNDANGASEATVCCG